MPTLDGVVTIVQESRFQLCDDGGVSHLFQLSPNALLEPDQLAPLARRQARVRVRFREGHGVLARVATRMTLLEA